MVAVAAAVVICLAGAPGVALASPTGPGDEQIGAAEAARDAAVQRLTELSTRLAEAQAQVDAANAAATISLDAFQGEQAEYQTAQVTAQSAAAAERAADAALTVARAELAAFARASYIQGTTAPGLQAMLDMKDPAQIIERATLLAAAGGHRADVLLDLARVQRLAVAAEEAAHAAVTRANILRQQAADALTAAEGMQAAAHQRTAALESDRTVMQDQLQQALDALSELEGAPAAGQDYTRQQAAAQAAVQVADGSVVEGDLPPVGAGSTAAAATALDAALSAVGLRYAWGGGSLTGPSLGFGIDAGVTGFDCSGLTRYAYAQAGISIPRNSTAQYQASPRVSRADLRLGDLVFWAVDVTDPATIHHVALYLGNGRIVEAPQSGATVHVTSMYWSGYIGAVRPSA
ncbi:NlpC/P60 family protein [Modestobacter sp. DSM 44400]|nr:NlpC/P60 family protein [Modestobacter sp. DSM 44400]